MGGPGPSRSSQPPADPCSDPPATITGLEPLPTFVIKRAKSKGTYKITTHLSVVIQLPGTASMRGVELEVSAKRVRLNAPLFAPLDIELPQLVQEEGTTDCQSSGACFQLIAIHAAVGKNCTSLIS